LINIIDEIYGVLELNAVLNLTLLSTEWYFGKFWRIPEKRESTKD
jgi:hypothetical protein